MLSKGVAPQFSVVAVFIFISPVSGTYLLLQFALDSGPGLSSSRAVLCCTACEGNRIIARRDCVGSRLLCCYLPTMLHIYYLDIYHAAYVRGSDSEVTSCRCSVLAPLAANCLDTERAECVMCDGDWECSSGREKNVRQVQR